MVQNTLYQTLEDLAERYIPEGVHKHLHVNSREAWTDLMVELIEAGRLSKRLSFLAKCAINWEALLIQKISIQN
jgi:hypothetical protein